MSYLEHGLYGVGSLLFFLSALGVVRLPDTLSRMHAAGKASVLGLTLLLGACVVHFGTATVAVKALVVVVAVFFTVPVATHLLARAAFSRQSGEKGSSK